MPIASWFAVYFILWWLCLFLVLPFGVRNQEEAGDVVRGTEPGAPILVRLWPKLLATTIVSAVLLAIVIFVLSSPVVQRYWG